MATSAEPRSIRPRAHRCASTYIMLALAAIALAGCGGDEESPTDPPTPDAADTTDGGALDTGPVITPDAGTRCARDEQCPDDRYCPPGEGAAVRICAFGCREGGCAIGLMCDLDERICVRDPSCETNDDCEPGEYCDDALCQPGCRLDDPEACPRNQNGEPRACDPETRTCAVQVVCCSADDACSLELPADCAEPLDGLRNCLNPNPCELRCAVDDDCGDEAYCADGACVEGCRTAPDNCGRERICDAETRTCIRPPCAEDTDCGPTLFCAFDVCLPGCRRDPDNCGPAEVCTEQNRCEREGIEPDPCQDDAECAADNPGWICLDGTCEPPCLDHAECADPLACIDGRCVEGCRDDGLEPNDDRASARPLAFDGLAYASDVLQACSRDRDWYRFDTPGAGTSIRLAVRFAHADGDVDVKLYAPDGRLAATGESGDDDEEIEYLAGPGSPSPAGTWYVEVYARGLAENTYTLEIELLGGVVPDDAEPDDAPVTATRLSLPAEQQSETIEGRTIHPGDEDWFVLDMGARDGVQIRLERLGNQTGQGDELTFEVFGPGAPVPGDPAVLGPNGGGEPPDGPAFEQLDVPRFNAVIQDGAYYIRVVGLDPTRFGAYRLTVAVDRDGVLCLPDAAEPNDVAGAAYDLMSVAGFTREGFDGVRELVPDADLALPGLTLCDEADHYSLLLREGDDLEVRIDRLEAQVAGDTIIEIRNALGELVESGRSGQRQNLARLRDATGGRYGVRVQSAAGVRTGYDLAVLRTAGPIVCAPDPYDLAEPANDARQNGALIMPGSYPDLTLCGADGDVDHFRFTVDTLATIEARLRFSHAQGDLELDLYYEDDPDALNAELPDGHSATDDETVTFQNRAPGTYHLRVRGLGDPTVRYTLELAVTERQFICPDDPTEPAETLDDAVVLGGDVLQRDDQWLCVRAPADRDTFLVTVPPNQRRAIAASYVFGDDGDLYLDLYDVDGMLRATTADIERGSSKQCVHIEPDPSNRVFFVQVAPLSINTVGDDDERLDYRLTVGDDDCDAIPPATPGVVWPTVVD